MTAEIREVGREALPQFAGIPIRFRVESVFRVEENDAGVGGFRLVEEKVEKPYVKDYDTFEGETPTCWATHLDVTHWGFFLALDGDKPVGAATVACDTPGCSLLEGRKDLAVLWDIRVHPDRRREGIGTKVFQCVRDWARSRGCTRLKVETQNTNVRACRFYAKQSCRLEGIHRHVYPPPLEHEVMLLWRLDL